MKKIIFCLMFAACFFVSGCSKDDEPTNTINGHEYVDLGLSVKWATCNVGATTLTGYGEYYKWGDIIPKGTNDNMPEIAETSIIEIAGTQYDVAHVEWGGSWRMANVTEWRELVEKCEWTWIDNGEKSGYKITGPNGNSIFLPACGIINGDSLVVTGTQAYYWTSTRCEDALWNSWGLHMEVPQYNIYGWDISNGMAIRAVTN